jgi:hypothetical protein
LLSARYGVRSPVVGVTTCRNGRGAMVEVEASWWSVAAPLTELPRHNPAMVSTERTRPPRGRTKFDRWIFDMDPDLTLGVE